MKSELKILENNGRRWVLNGDKPVGALCSTMIRTFVYPLFTPGGVIVLQECPPDHPHQQGLMVGQDFVNGHNFWAMGNPRYPQNTQGCGQVIESVDAAGANFIVHLRWTTKEGQAVLNEERRIRFEAKDDFHLVDMTTIWTAAYGDVYIGKTKEGGMGMRVHPQLEAFWGGGIRSSEGAIGEKEVFDTQADWLEVHGQVEGRAVGVVMMPHPSQPKVPWFTRDYGIHLYGPYRNAGAKIAAGDQVSMRVGFAAYDGPSDGSPADRAWQHYLTVSK